MGFSSSLPIIASRDHAKPNTQTKVIQAVSGLLGGHQACVLQNSQTAMSKIFQPQRIIGLFFIPDHFTDTGLEFAKARLHQRLAIMDDRLSDNEQSDSGHYLNIIDNVFSNGIMALVEKGHKPRVREMISFRQDLENGDTHSLIRFKKPVDIKDTGLLTLDYDQDKDSDQWIYLPAVKKSRRISSKRKGGRFVGFLPEKNLCMKKRLILFQLTIVQQIPGVHGISFPDIESGADHGMFSTVIPVFDICCGDDGSIR